MEKAAWMISFKLKDGVTKEDFIEATRRLHDNVLSKQKGFISWEQWLDKDTWTDFVVWETIEDAQSAMTAGSGKEEAKQFYAMLQMKTCSMTTSTFVKKY
ncbi:hypothetical protein IGI37_001104 [Enterococcus sp. AZ194]|uniref:hypothetical protein n=1 Tax=Enterococcus sp. AZ194 TaxID=2774629 RepID=UPI003F263185